jgi:hypothetical protein
MRATARTARPHRNPTTIGPLLRGPNGLALEISGKTLQRIDGKDFLVALGA